MKIFLEFLVVFSGCILPQIAGTFFVLKDKNYFQKLTPKQRIVTNWVTHIGSIILIIYVGTNHATGIESIGLSLSKNALPKIIIVSGLTTGYLSLIFFSQKLRSKKKQEEREKLRRTAFEAGGFSSFNGFWERGYYLVGMWLGVVAEDLVFRGFLVLGLGIQTGIFWPWIILSVFLSIIVHLYQGTNPRLMLSQGLFALIFILVTLITNSVLAAIIPHLVYDTIWMLRGWAKTSRITVPQSEPVG